MFFIFPDTFSREKTLSFLSHGLLPVPNVKSSPFYRTTNAITLVRQTNKTKRNKTSQPNKPKKYTVLVMAIVSGVGVSCDPCLLQEPTLVLNQK